MVADGVMSPVSSNDMEAGIEANPGTGTVMELDFSAGAGERANTEVGTFLGAWVCT